VVWMGEQLTRASEEGERKEANRFRWLLTGMNGLRCSQTRRDDDGARSNRVEPGPAGTVNHIWGWRIRPFSIIFLVRYEVFSRGKKKSVDDEEFELLFGGFECLTFMPIVNWPFASTVDSRSRWVALPSIATADLCACSMAA